MNSMNHLRAQLIRFNVRFNALDSQKKKNMRIHVCRCPIGMVGSSAGRDPSSYNLFTSLWNSGMKEYYGIVH